MLPDNLEQLGRRRFIKMAIMSTAALTFTSDFNMAAAELPHLCINHGQQCDRCVTMGIPFRPPTQLQPRIMNPWLNPRGL